MMNREVSLSAEKIQKISNSTHHVLSNLDKTIDSRVASVSLRDTMIKILGSRIVIYAFTRGNNA